MSKLAKESATNTIQDMELSNTNGEGKSQVLSLSTPHNDHLLLSCIIDTNGIAAQIQEFLDCGTSNEFYDLNSAHRNNLPINLLPQPRQLYLADSKLTAQITHTTTFKDNLLGKEKILTPFLTSLGRYELILGHIWFKKYNPFIDWSNDIVYFSSNYCKQ